jgi:hypothetical protein
MPGDRRRFAVAYLCSILIHAVALVLLAAFVLRSLTEGGGTPESVVADRQLIIRTETAPPVTSPPPVVVHTAAPLVRPRIVQVPVPPRPRPKTVPTVPPVPSELARIVPNATPQPPSPPPVNVPEPLPPTPVPTARPTIAPTVRPTAEPTVRPTPEPTVRPTPEPTVRPTPEPTPEPTVRPTAEPTERPTQPPTAAPTSAPTTVPTARPTAAPTARPTAAPTQVATAVAERASPRPAAVAAAPGPATARPAPPRVVLPATPIPAPVHVAVALTTPSPRPPSPAPSATPAATGLGNLNDRIRAALPTKPTAGMREVPLGPGYSTNRVLDAYEATLAPPLEILAKTFGLIYTTRTLARADSVEYVYERVHGLLGKDVCRAYKITEHPLRPSDSRPDVSKPGALTLPGALHDVKPDIETVEVPCDAPGMIKVEPGSITTPVPRRRP